MDFLSIAALIIALYGGWLAYKGNKIGFKPKVLNGWALVMVAAALMLREFIVLYWILLTIAVLIFIWSIRIQWQALIQQRRRRR